jgi:hypothetical protein
MTLAQQTTPENTGGPLDEQTALIYGEVVTVKPIPTRQVTQIVIEIPEEFHIQATQLLFKRNAFILPCAEKTPLAGATFGVTTLGAAMNPPPAPEPQPERPKLNIPQWLAIKGQDHNFQQFLGATDAEDAARIVRERCRVESRADIAGDEHALRVFMQEIYTPFSSRFHNVRKFSPSANSGTRR